MSPSQSYYLEVWGQDLQIFICDKFPANADTDKWGSRFQNLMLEWAEIFQTDRSSNVDSVIYCLCDFGQVISFI